MMFTRVRMLVSVVASLCAVTAARAQTNEQKPKLTDAELQIMAKLHHANQMEIDMGKLASERSKSAEVKGYAARLTKDHTKADGKLNDLAKKLGATIPTPTPKDDAEKKQMEEAMAAMNRLKQLEGEEFDREFANVMVTDHMNAIKMVSDAQGQAQEPKLIALLKEVKPVLEKHQAAAEKLAGKDKEKEKKPSGGTAAPKP